MVFSFSLRGGKVVALAAYDPGLASTLVGTGWVPLLRQMVLLLVAHWLIHCVIWSVEGTGVWR